MLAGHSTSSSTPGEAKAIVWIMLKSTFRDSAGKDKVLYHVYRHKTYITQSLINA